MAKSVEELAKEIAIHLFGNPSQDDCLTPDSVFVLAKEKIAAAIREDRAEPVSEAEIIYKKALERISKSQLYDNNTLHPQACAQLATDALQAARQARATADEKGGAR